MSKFYGKLEDLEMERSPCPSEGEVNRRNSWKKGCKEEENKERENEKRDIGTSCGNQETEINKRRKEEK